MKSNREASEGAVIHHMSQKEWVRIGRVGYSVNFRKRVVHWLDFFLYEQWRRQGIGTKVYRWLENHLINEYSVRTIFLIMLEEDSLPFWEKMGFDWNRKDLDESE